MQGLAQKTIISCLYLMLMAALHSLALGDTPFPPALNCCMLHMLHTGQLATASQLVCRPGRSGLLQGTDGSLAHTARQCQRGVSCCAAPDDHKHLGLGRKHRGCSHQGGANLSQPKAHPCCQIAGPEVRAERGKVQCLITHCSLYAGLSEQKPPASSAQGGTANLTSHA